jgi:hypothetical protein
MPSGLNKALFRNLTGVELDQILREVPKPSHIKALLDKELETGYPDKILFLGQTSEGPLYITQEDLTSHFHILGAPNQGKSKLITAIIEQLVYQGYGVCFLDPTDNGDTMYNILKWCIKVGFEKVCLIDPHDKAFKIPTILPTHNLMETVRILFNQDDWRTPRIQRFLPSLFYALRRAEMSLAELRFFITREAYAFERHVILEHIPSKNWRRADLEAVFLKQMNFTPFESTINRLVPFLESYMAMMFGLTEPAQCIDFHKMVRDGWLILCNLDHKNIGMNFDVTHQRLIGTAVINELFAAVSHMQTGNEIREENKKKGDWKGKYNIVIDEVGDYATENLVTIMDKKRKSGIRLFMAHQRFNQLPPHISNAVESAGIKALFFTKLPEDRMSNGDEQIVEVYIPNIESEHLFNPAAGIEQEENQRVKPLLAPGVRFKADELGNLRF